MSEKCQSHDTERGSASGQSGNPQSIWDKFGACYAWLPPPLHKTLDWMSERFEIESDWGRGLYIAAYMIVILMYPLHYYAYVIKSDQNCLQIDNELYATIAAVLFFNFYMLLYTPNFFKKLISSHRSSKTMCKPDHCSKTAKESYDSSKIAIEHFAFTQIPVLLMTLTLIPDLKTGTTDKIFLTTANLFLFGYILLVIGLSLTIKNATEGTAFIARAKWAKAAYNLFLYLLGGHVFGALWYSFAIDRILACWREDYFLRNRFNPQSFVCRDKHKNIGELSCPKIKQNVGEITGFGIFDDALRSRIVGLKSQFLKKFLYCLRWGLQALSCFGQNLSPSTFIMENIFVVSVIIYSTVLFIFLIGNMQEYLKPEDKSVVTREEMTLFQVQEPKQSTLKQKQTVEQYVSFQKLPQELQMKVKDNLQPNKWRETKILHVDTLFNIQGLLRDIKIELCLPQLRKVEEFVKLGEEALKDLCNEVKLVFYRHCTLIVQKEDPINEILFVLHGVLQTHDSSGTGYLKDGEFFGKELVTLFNNQAEAHSSGLPTSSTTVYECSNVENKAHSSGLPTSSTTVYACTNVENKAHSSGLPTSSTTVYACTNVETFVLMAYDVKKIFVKYNQQQAN